MTQNPRRRRRRKKNHLAPVAIVLSVILVGLILVVMFMGGDEPKPTDPIQTTTAPTTTAPTTVPPTTTEPPIVKESSFTLSAVGDMLMHMPVVNSGYYANTNSYNLDTIFTYFTDHVQSADFAVGNLETTLAGTDNGYNYSGYPQFNCPDAIIDSMKTAGFDLVLTANNHSYDTRGVGLKRTLEVIRDRELGYLGTKVEADDPNFLVVERNGIKLGLACYTYEDNSDPAIKAPNYITMSAEHAPLINTFDYTNLNLFYDELSDSMAQADQQGADAFVLFIHWGYEYQTTQHSIQSQIAQSLCDIGVDVIVGGHPHVVQPVELLTSTTDETQKTVCLYSMGNAVSNQRRQNMNLNTGHTEDGVMFSVTFSRYSDGTVILESAECLPTWVNLHYNTETAHNEYNILPLDKDITDWKSAFNLTDSTLAGCEASYDRTMAIVGAGMEAVDAYLAANQAAVEEALGVE
jgi:poly-gamma-glutamate synthesis protein (capsule biosynthesis protein)